MTLIMPRRALMTPPTLFAPVQYINATNLTTYTSTALSFPEPDARRYAILGFHTRRNGATSISSVSIGGVTATPVVSLTATNRAVAIYIAHVPTGTSAVCVVTMGQQQDGIGMSLWRAYDLRSMGAVDKNVRTVTGTTCDFPSTATANRGFAVGIIGGQTAASSFSWPSPWTNRHVTVAEDVHIYSGADAPTDGSNIAPIVTGTNASALLTGAIATFR